MRVREAMKTIIDVPTAADVCYVDEMFAGTIPLSSQMLSEVWDDYFKTSKLLGRDPQFGETLDYWLDRHFINREFRILPSDSVKKDVRVAFVKKLSEM